MYASARLIAGRRPVAAGNDRPRTREDFRTHRARAKRPIQRGYTVRAEVAQRSSPKVALHGTEYASERQPTPAPGFQLTSRGNELAALRGTRSGAQP